VKTSEVSGFYKLSPKQRLAEVAEFAGLTEDEQKLILNTGALSLDQADRMIENVIGAFQLPLGVAVNFLINGKDYLIPMSVEEPSVVAAASNAAKIVRKTGGFFTSNTGPIMKAQVQVVNVKDPFYAKAKILENKDEIIKIANAQDPMLISLGGGMQDLEVRVLDSIIGPMVVIHLIVNTLDAMGANTVNTMAEAVAPHVEKITGGRVYLRILSNLADRRLVRARTLASKEALGGEEVVDGIVTAYAFAEADPYRAATHNKGIMNGITPVITATGNDTRAIEAGAHSYAARSGRYKSLTVWEKNADGDLVGTLEMPMAVGLIGGATKVHPIAKIAVKILGVKTAVELGEVICAVGLAQNLTAIKALATEGIQRGHMELHARNIAAMAGADPKIADKVIEIMVRDKKVRIDYAKELIEKFKQ
jgi:hydroxymethylglutaryl-CoA reductase